MATQNSSPLLIQFSPFCVSMLMQFTHGLSIFRVVAACPDQLLQGYLELIMPVFHVVDWCQMNVVCMFSSQQWHVVQHQWVTIRIMQVPMMQGRRNTPLANSSLSDVLLQSRWCSS